MSYFVEGFDTQHKRAVLQWAREDYDGWDNRWWWSMSWLFDVAAEIYERPGIFVPYELGYRPGAGGAEISEGRAEGLALMSDEALMYAAYVLNRYTRALERAGESY